VDLVILTGHVAIPGSGLAGGPVSQDLEGQCANRSLESSLVSQWNPESSLSGDLNAGSEWNQEVIVWVEPNWIHVLQFGVSLFCLK
jgi:hypothetical protein